MKISFYLAISFILISSSVDAKSVEHLHGSRTHTHILPEEVSHSHRNGPVSKIPSGEWNYSDYATTLYTGDRSAEYITALTYSIASHTILIGTEDTKYGDILGILVDGYSYDETYIRYKNRKFFFFDDRVSKGNAYLKHNEEAWTDEIPKHKEIYKTVVLTLELMSDLSLKMQRLRDLEKKSVSYYEDDDMYKEAIKDQKYLSKQGIKLTTAALQFFKSVKKYLVQVELNRTRGYVYSKNYSIENQIKQIKINNNSSIENAISKYEKLVEGFKDEINRSKTTIQGLGGDLTIEVIQ